MYNCKPEAIGRNLTVIEVESTQSPYEIEADRQLLLIADGDVRLKKQLKDLVEILATTTDEKKEEFRKIDPEMSGKLIEIAELYRKSMVGTIESSTVTTGPDSTTTTPAITSTESFSETTPDSGQNLTTIEIEPAKDLSQSRLGPSEDPNPSANESQCFEIVRDLRFRSRTLSNLLTQFLKS
jgi:hypothetical protein